MAVAEQDALEEIRGQARDNPREARRVPGRPCPALEDLLRDAGRGPGQPERRLPVSSPSSARRAADRTTRSERQTQSRSGVDPAVPADTLLIVTEDLSGPLRTRTAPATPDKKLLSAGIA